MKKQKYRSLVLLGIMMALSTIVCSSGYITPASLTETARNPSIEGSPVPTVIFSFPTDTPTQLPASNPTLGETEVPTTTGFTSPTPLPSLSPTSTPIDVTGPPILYYAQAGDTLYNLSVRFAVHPSEIVSSEPIPEDGFIEPDQLLMIPLRLANTTPSEHLIPDSEVVYSPSAINFDAITYANTLGGYLTLYRDYLGATGWTNGPDILQRVAIENSINPRLLLSLLEYQSGWVLGNPGNLAQTNYPMGLIDLQNSDLYDQLVWAVNILSVGYYSWREGTLTELHFPNGDVLRLAPDQNAGTVALYYFFSQLYDIPQWRNVIDPSQGFTVLHHTMFSDPWERAAQVEPLLPPGLEQPALILPFLIGQRWSYTGGPHGAWEGEGSMAAIDFAPGSIEPGCVDSDSWVVASSPGMIVRTGNGVMVLDLDGDGIEQTGWVMLYLHLTNSNGPLTVGTWVEKSEMLGHPSCEGGMATGTHIHIARKYNGEWIAADGPLPFVLSGWQAHAGIEPYEGSLTRGDEVINACTCGSFDTLIKRYEDDP
jgi:hypothetical protein